MLVITPSFSDDDLGFFAGGPLRVDFFVRTPSTDALDRHRRKLCQLSLQMFRFL
jgi:hypothetical protein